MVAVAIWLVSLYVVVATIIFTGRIVYDILFWERDILREGAASLEAQGVHCNAAGTICLGGAPCALHVEESRRLGLID